MIRDEEVYSSIDDYDTKSSSQGISSNNNNTTTEGPTMKQITDVDYSYDGQDGATSTISLEDEYKILNKIPVTTAIQYLYYAFLVLTVLSSLSLISVGQALVSLIFIGYGQFLSSIMGVAGAVLFFNFGDTVAKRRQALIFVACFTAQIAVVSFVLFIVLIYWLIAGLYGAGGPFALTLIVMFQCWSQILVGALMSWRMYVHL